MADEKPQCTTPDWHKLDRDWSASGDAIMEIPEHLLSPPWRMLMVGDGSPTRTLQLLSGLVVRMRHLRGAFHVLVPECCRSKTAVDVVDMSHIGSSLDDAPTCVEQIESPRLRRQVSRKLLRGQRIPPTHPALASLPSCTFPPSQVWLQNTRGERMGYAVSWWNESMVQQHLQDAQLPIWVSLAQRKTETFREVLGKPAVFGQDSEPTASVPSTKRVRFAEVYRGSSPELEKEFGHKGPFWGRHYFFWREGCPLTLISEVFSPQLVLYLGPVAAPSPPPAELPAAQGHSECQQQEGE